MNASTSAQIRAMTKDLIKQAPARVQQLHEDVLAARHNWQQNPSYSAGMSYAYKVGVFHEALTNLSEQPESPSSATIMEMIGYEKHMCQQYWKELVDGPMLVSFRKPRNS